ncbi:hypothetical protein OsccyDRAFT_4583 [Leptolyngbyaceae cyanobacterium JSC-12]|nr:hypothetical protein OsccyDRAFT_4583 [Leptolyngbyaceae cyanobacterium JSC-12]
MKRKKLNLLDKKFDDIQLPKWSGLIVVGDPVTKDQAKEILIQTDTLQFDSSYMEMKLKYSAYLYGIENYDENSYFQDAYDFFRLDNGNIDWERYEDARTRIICDLGLLDIRYINNHRILSSSPIGWCDWNGYIGCNSYNVSEDPTVEDVYLDWLYIAETFSFLKLRSQLFDQEAGKADAKPVVEFKIENSYVEVVIPSEPLGVFETQGDDRSEIGCSFEQFKEAVDLRKSKRVRTDETIYFD